MVKAAVHSRAAKGLKTGMSQVAGFDSALLPLPIGRTLLSRFVNRLLCQLLYAPSQDICLYFNNQLSNTKITESPLKNLDTELLISMYHLRRPKQTDILLMNLSLFTGLPFFPPASRGVSVHISLTFSNTMLQCRSKALTLANSFRLFRHEIKTCVCDRTAVCRIERGPDVNSCSSSSDTSYSLRRR